MGWILRQNIEWECISIEQILKNNKPIVFVDEFIGSGKQAVSILETWFGRKLTYDLGEWRGVSLNKEVQNLLKRGK